MISRSLLFSTTVTWNCRGSSTMANERQQRRREQQRRRPARWSSTAAACRLLASPSANRRRRTVEHAEGDEDADREEGDQLDHRLGGDREHQAVLVLGRVDVAGAEQHRERRHRQRDEQRDVAEQRLGDWRRSAPHAARMVVSEDDTALSCSAM